MLLRIRGWVGVWETVAVCVGRGIRWLDGFVANLTTRYYLGILVTEHGNISVRAIEVRFGFLGCIG